MLETSYLFEVGVSTIRRSAQSKRNALAVAYALKIAREKNDPMYKKYTKFNRLRKKLKAMIFKKYSGRATMQARSKLSNTSSMGSRKPNDSKTKQANASTVIQTVSGGTPSSR